VTTLMRRAWAIRRLGSYRCRACARSYPRKLRRCPDCRTRKYEYGYGIQRMHWGP
jgi:hypothetical protein